MYPLLHSALGKLTVGTTPSGGFLLPPSGLVRLFGAFCAILAIALLLDAAPAPQGLAASVATDVKTKEGNRR